MGKGDKRRPGKGYEENYEKIFGSALRKRDGTNTRLDARQERGELEEDCRKAQGYGSFYQSSPENI
jgi:hypothetical protein